MNELIATIGDFLNAHPLVDSLIGALSGFSWLAFFATCALIGWNAAAAYKARER